MRRESPALPARSGWAGCCSGQSRAGPENSPAKHKPGRAMLEPNTTTSHQNQPITRKAITGYTRKLRHLLVACQNLLSKTAVHYKAPLVTRTNHSNSSFSPFCHLGSGNPCRHDCAPCGHCCGRRAHDPPSPSSPAPPGWRCSSPWSSRWV